RCGRRAPGRPREHDFCAADAVGQSRRYAAKALAGIRYFRRKRLVATVHESSADRRTHRCVAGDVGARHSAWLSPNGLDAMNRYAMLLITRSGSDRKLPCTKFTPQVKRMDMLAASSTNSATVSLPAACAC